MGSEYNVAILAAIAAYVVITLPWIEKFVVLVLGLLFASIFGNPSMRDFAFKVLGAVNRRVFYVVVGRINKDDIRTKAMQICASVDQYPAYMKSVLNRKRRLFFMLDKAQQSQAIDTYKTLRMIESCSEINFEALCKLKLYAMEEFNISQRDLWGQQANPYDAVEIIEHLVRDWSDSNHHGKARELLFGPLWPHLTNKKRVLVPGSGLGRLPYDLGQKLGNDAIVDAPELSPSMYIGSLYTTSRTSRESFELYPYLLEFSHLKRRADQCEPAMIELPNSTKKSRGTTFHYADFLTFDHGHKYDAIVTLFFIDTAQNVFRYIDRIAEMLTPGGIWLNYGPLKWGTAAFVEFSSDELVSYLEKSGWVIENTWSGANRYNGSKDSMLKTEYELIGWAARKK